MKYLKLYETVVDKLNNGELLSHIIKASDDSILKDYQVSFDFPIKFIKKYYKDKIYIDSPKYISSITKLSFIRIDMLTIEIHDGKKSLYLIKISQYFNKNDNPYIKFIIEVQGINNKDLDRIGLRRIGTDDIDLTDNFTCKNIECIDNYLKKIGEVINLLFLEKKTKKYNI